MALKMWACYRHHYVCSTEIETKTIEAFASEFPGNTKEILPYVLVIIIVDYNEMVVIKYPYTKGY